MRILSYLLAFGLLLKPVFSEAQNPDIRNYTTQRIIGEVPKIDGKLTDLCWKQGEWTTNFIQWTPNEGASPTMPTEAKILYNDKSIFVAIRAIDYEPGKIKFKSTRYDQLAGDMAGVAFDSYHDHRTGFEFDVTAAGQKADMLLTNPINNDINWNAIWTCKTGSEDSAWVAEFEIPFSQLRYGKDKNQTWGLHIWRWIDRVGEESDWEKQTSTGPGIVYLFGHLDGLNDIPQSRRIELMPYISGDVQSFKADKQNPFTNTGNSNNFNIGLDAKIGLSSNFTADLTINPDFGQVEADPSEINLTAFETFFQEKRPFFLEGKNIFNFSFGNSNLFYSRRIGHKPTYTIKSNEADYADLPGNTSIISAAKISGKTSNGLSVGLLQSVTNKAVADVSLNNEMGRITVEPLTSYSVGRIQKDYNNGATCLGGIFTAVNRITNEKHFDYLPENSFTAGIDLLHLWKDKEYFVTAKLIGSSVSGSEKAIRILQRSPARYLHRPDATPGLYNESLSSLSGHGGEISIGKGSKGLWKYSAGTSWRSEGLELNDLGFMNKADLFESEGKVSYGIVKPTGRFRTYSIDIRFADSRDFRMNYLNNEIAIDSRFEFLNKMRISPFFHYITEGFDNRLLRGGTTIRVPGQWVAGSSFNTNNSKKLSLQLNGSYNKWDGIVSKTSYINPQITYQPVSTVRIVLGSFYNKGCNDMQFIPVKENLNPPVYLLARLNQETVGATIRFEYFVNPMMSVQYYGSPYFSVGNFEKYKIVVEPNAGTYSNRFIEVSPIPFQDEYKVDIGNNSIQFANPGFGFTQFRSNLVYRWEYAKGSQIYFIWSGESSLSVSGNENTLQSTFGNFTKSTFNSTFLIKWSYWLSI